MSHTVMNRMGGSGVTPVMENQDSDLHGKTAQLTESEVSDLVTYLKTL